MEIYSLLKKDHETISSLFEKLEQTSGRAKKAREKIFAEIKLELMDHSEAEKTAFYDPMQSKKEAKDKILEANEEHGLVAHLIQEISSLPPDDERWMAKCSVLKEVAEHHVKQEEGEIFKTAKKLFDKKEAQDMGAHFLQLKKQHQAALEQNQGKKPKSAADSLEISA